MGCPVFRETVKNQKHPKHKFALAANQNTRNWQAENEYLQNKDMSKEKLTANSLKLVSKDQGNGKTDISYKLAAANAFNKLG